MYFIRSTEEIFIKKDGTKHFNRMINLSNVITIQKKMEASSNPGLYIIQFSCNDGTNREWLYSTRHDMMKTYEKIYDYIKTVQNTKL